MRKESDAQKIKTLTEYFKKRDDVAMAFLFGSRAGGQIRKSSDWDIGVYLNESRTKSSSLEFTDRTKKFLEESRVSE